MFIDVTLCFMCRLLNMKMASALLTAFQGRAQRKRRRFMRGTTTAHGCGPFKGVGMQENEEACGSSQMKKRPGDGEKNRRMKKIERR